MVEYNEKHYSIDAGEGFKMEGCPYSLYEDGHDVYPFIIPPKGFKLIGFKLVVFHDNHLYDGKLIAQYEKVPIGSILAANLWKIIVGIVAVAVIVVGIVLVSNVLNKPSPKPVAHSKPAVEVVTIDSIFADTAAFVTDTICDSVQNESESDTLDPDSHVAEEELVTSSNSIQNEPSGDILDLASRFVFEKSMIPTDTCTAFKEEFWTLIHDRNIQMNSYDALYKRYKNEAFGVEYNYLRLVILKDGNTFNVWYKKLKKIPSDELKSVETVDQLIEKLNAVQ